MVRSRDPCISRAARWLYSLLLRLLLLHKLIDNSLGIVSCRVPDTGSEIDSHGRLLILAVCRHPLFSLLPGIGGL